MAFSKETFGTLENGAVITKYTLTNKHGLKASFTDLGGIWLEMWVPDKHGTLADVVLGYDEPEKYLHQDAHFGEIVGRNANRISNATCTIDGITYALVINDNGINNLHSGPDFLRDRIWDAEISETEAGTKITFSLFSPDGDQNYPGNADIRVSYTLTEDDAVRIDYHMTCDEDTIANFTNHAYFNLAGQGSGSALDQKVWIDADQFTLSDQYCVTTGELVDMFCSAWGNGLSWENKSDGGPHEANFLKLDCSKLKTIFGWHPRYGVKEAIGLTVEWCQEYEKNGDVVAVMDRQIKEMFQ